MGWNKKPRPEDNDPEYKKIKDGILKRDKYTCKLCNKKHRRSYLEVHHIIPYSDSVYLRQTPDNLITLCRKCHKSIKDKEGLYIRCFQTILQNQQKIQDYKKKKKK